MNASGFISDQNLAVTFESATIRHAIPHTRTPATAPDLAFDRESPIGHRDSLNYQIVTDWLIAEHKSQGLFQSEYSRHRFDEFWRFEAGGDEAAHRLSELQAAFHLSRLQTAAQKGNIK